MIVGPCSKGSLRICALRSGFLGGSVVSDNSNSLRGSTQKSTWVTAFTKYGNTLFHPILLSGY